MAAMRSWRLNGADAEVAAAVSAVVVTELARIETIERPAPPTPSLTRVGAPGLASVALCEGRIAARSGATGRSARGTPRRCAPSCGWSLEPSRSNGALAVGLVRSTLVRAHVRDFRSAALEPGRAFPGSGDRRGEASGHQSRRVFRERRHGTPLLTAQPYHVRPLFLRRRRRARPPSSATRPAHPPG